jgi:hypothetical protein
MKPSFSRGRAREGGARRGPRRSDCHPVRDWAIFDLARSKKLPYGSAKRRHNRHLARLQEIFRVPADG